MRGSKGVAHEHPLHGKAVVFDAVSVVVSVVVSVILEPGPVHPGPAALITRDHRDRRGETQALSESG